MGVEALARAIRVGSSWLAAVQSLAEMKPLSHPTVIVLVCILWPTASHLRLVVLRADINIVSTCQFRAAKCVGNMVGALTHGPWPMATGLVLPMWLLLLLFNSEARCFEIIQVSIQ